MLAGINKGVSNMINIYISKSDSNLQVDWDNMPEASKAHIIQYGLRQKLNDAGSSATEKALGKDEAGKQALALAENVLEALMEGKVTVRQAAISQTLEEREYSKLVKSLAKRAKLKADTDETLPSLIARLANALKLDEAALIEKLLAKATANAETERKVRAIRAESPVVELEL